MVAIDIEIPKNCVECNRTGLQQMIDCQLIYRGCANCGRHPDCPLVEIVTCKDCKHCCHITNTPKVLLCEKHNCQQVSKNFYCANGERKE